MSEKLHVQLEEMSEGEYINIQEEMTVIKSMETSQRK